MTLSLRERIKTGVAADKKRWPTYDGGELNRQNFLTASEAMSCERKLWFEKHAIILPEQDSWGYAQRGHAYEAWLVQQITASLGACEELHHAGEEQVSFYIPESKIAGTPDGLLLTFPDDYSLAPTGATLLEIKSFDPRKNVNKLPDPRHVAQANINMMLIGACTEYPVNRAILSYGNASNFEDQHEFPLKFDPSHYYEAVKRAERIFGLNNPADTNPEGLRNDDCKYCAFRSECSELIGKPVEELEHEAVTPTMNLPEIAAPVMPRSIKGKVRRFLELKQKEKDLKEQMKDLDDAVRNYVLDKGGEVTLGSATITVSEQPGKKTVDKPSLTKFLKQHGKNYSDFEKTGKPYSRLDVKLS